MTKADGSCIPPFVSFEKSKVQSGPEHLGYLPGQRPPTKLPCRLAPSAPRSPGAPPPARSTASLFTAGYGAMVAGLGAGDPAISVAPLGAGGAHGATVRNPANSHSAASNTR